MAGAGGQGQVKVSHRLLGAEGGLKISQREKRPLVAIHEGYHQCHLALHRSGLGSRLVRIKAVAGVFPDVADGSRPKGVESSAALTSSIQTARHEGPWLRGPGVPAGVRSCYSSVMMDISESTAVHR